MSRVTPLRALLAVVATAIFFKVLYTEQSMSGADYQLAPRKREVTHVPVAHEKGQGPSGGQGRGAWVRGVGITETPEARTRQDLDRGWYVRGGGQRGGGTGAGEEGGRGWPWHSGLGAKVGDSGGGGLLGGLLHHGAAGAARAARQQRPQGSGPNGDWPLGPTRIRGPVVLSRRNWTVGAEIATPIRTIGTMTQELYDILPDGDIFENTTFRTCAVIGSAGILLLRKMGRVIDSHDAVFRFNCATTDGLSDFVGHRTTIRLVNRDHVGFRESPEEVCIQQISTEIVLKQYELLRQADPSAQTYAMDPMFSQRVIVKKSTPPTNGFYGIKLALELCDRVYLYGFIRRWQYLVEGEAPAPGHPPRAVRFMDYHYHDDYSPKDSQAHRDSKEWPLIQGLLSENPGRLVVAHPCVVSPHCRGCPEGATCLEGVPFPVPAPGFCYGHGDPVVQDAHGPGDVVMPQPDERRACFRRCARGGCPGGLAGICGDGELAGGCGAWRDVHARFSDDAVPGWRQSPGTLVDTAPFRASNASGVIAAAEQVRIRLTAEAAAAAPTTPAPKLSRKRREREGEREKRRLGKGGGHT